MGSKLGCNAGFLRKKTSLIRRSRRRRIAKVMLRVFFVLSLWPGSGQSQEIVVAGFNVESGGADPDVVAEYIEQVDGVDLWGLSEVQNTDWLETFEAAAGSDEGYAFSSELSDSGRADRLAVVYNDDLFDLVDIFELDEINIGGSVRSALVAHLNFEDDGGDFLFMVNHLYRTKPQRRHEQARLLNSWAQKQSLPVVAVGDYNFDWSVGDGDRNHDKGFDLMTEGGVWTWVRPRTLIKTQCSPRYNGVLDFIFVAGSAQSWNAESEILFREPGYCGQSNERSDHRPVLARLNMNARPEIRDLGTDISLVLSRLDQLETELSEIRALVAGEQ